MDLAYGAVKQSLEVTEAETQIFKQLDIDVIDWIKVVWYWFFEALT